MDLPSEELSRALRFKHAASLRMDFIAGEENHPRVVAVIVLDNVSTEVLLTIQKRLAGIVMFSVDQSMGASLRAIAEVMNVTAPKVAQSSRQLSESWIIHLCASEPYDSRSFSWWSAISESPRFLTPIFLQRP